MTYTLFYSSLEVKKLRFIYPKRNSESNMVLVEGSKNGRPGLKILPPLYTHESNGSYTADVIKFFEG